MILDIGFIVPFIIAGATVIAYVWLAYLLAMHS